MAVKVGEAQMGAGVRAFVADDHPHPLRPARQVQQPGELGDPRARPHLPPLRHRQVPRSGAGG
jgi:hypothetical protein